MSLLFKNKYRVRSARHPDWDYSQDGYYFVTICTKNREEFFGKIINEEIQLSEIGKIVWKFWREIPKHFPFVKLDESIVMPNHVHGILIIENPVETRHGVSLQQPQNKNQFSRPITGSVSVIVNHFKGSVTRWCRKNNRNYFQWQSRFYDHIIRNNLSLNRIREYIRINPERWEEDCNNPKNISA